MPLARNYLVQYSHAFGTWNMEIMLAHQCGDTNVKKKKKKCHHTFRVYLKSILSLALSLSLSRWHSLFFLHCQVLLSDSKDFTSPEATLHQGRRREREGKKQKTKSIFSFCSSKENTSADGVTHRRPCTCSYCASPNLPVRLMKAHPSAQNLADFFHNSYYLSPFSLLCANLYFSQCARTVTSRVFWARCLALDGTFRPGVIYRSSSNHFKSMQCAAACRAERQWQC